MYRKKGHYTFSLKGLETYCLFDYVQTFVVKSRNCKEKFLEKGIYVHVKNMILFVIVVVWFVFLFLYFDKIQLTRLFLAI